LIGSFVGQCVDYAAQPRQQPVRQGDAAEGRVDRVVGGVGRFRRLSFLSRCRQLANDALLERRIGIEVRHHEWNRFHNRAGGLPTWLARGSLMDTLAPLAAW
jgi:hypothetical protein